MSRPKAQSKASVSASFVATAALSAPGLKRGLPNGLTLASLGLGFLAALAAGQGNVGQALDVLALAALADALAGLTAQGLRQATPMGAELDSLASLVVWGLAVALLLYARGLEALGLWGLALAGLVVVAAAWRLCRGDAQKGRDRYEGLPGPVAGVLLVAAAALEVPAPWLAALIVALALAQVGPWTYPRFRPGLVWFMPIFLSLGFAAFGWSLGWVLPGLAAAVYAVTAPLFSARRK